MTFKDYGYIFRLAHQGDIFLSNADKNLSTLEKAQNYVKDMNPSLAMDLWRLETDLKIYKKLVNELKEAHGTPEKES